jgi:hypothetical protein
MPFPRSILSRADGEFMLRILETVEQFEDALKRGESPALEEVLSGAKSAERVELLCQCLGVELDYRRQRGEHPTQDEYLRRFPVDESVVRSAFQELSATPVTTLTFLTLSDCRY